jgi:hypothetical protein
MSETKNDRPAFKIYRAADAPSLEEAGCLSMAPLGPEAMSAFMKLTEAGVREGEETRVLVNIPGFSLTHVWFMRDFPLPLHSHDADCLYYVIAGSLARASGRRRSRRSRKIRSRGRPTNCRPSTPDG